jgi:large subunit ribosomal protein L10
MTKTTDKGHEPAAYKKWIKDDVKRRLGAERSVVVLKLDKFSVERANDLRAKLRAEGSRMTVVRNRVARVALQELEMGGASDVLSGMSAIAYGGADGVLGVSRVLSDWTKKHKDAGVQILGGFVDGQRISSAQVETMATLPNRQQLLSMIASVVAAPMQQIASQVNELLAGVARAVDAVRETKEKAG